MVAASASAWARARARARSLAFSGRSAVCSSRRLLMMSWRRRIGRARDCAGGSRGGTGRPSRQGPGPARRQPPTPGALPRSPSYGGCPEGRGPWSPYPHRLRRCFGCGAASGVAPRAPTAPSQLSDGRPAREPISGTCPSSWSERTRSTLARTPDGRARGAVRCSAVPGLPPCRPVRAGDTRTHWWRRGAAQQAGSTCRAQRRSCWAPGLPPPCRTSVPDEAWATRVTADRGPG